MDIIRFLLLMFCLLGLFTVKAQLRRNYYSKTCPNVESIVQSAVTAQFNQAFLFIPCTLSVFFVDCFVQGCDASILILSTPTNTAERDHPDILSLAGDGFDTVIKAKEAVEAKCKNTVSCADILAMATRDVVALAGGPAYPVELGRLDGLKSTAVSVNGKLPQPGFNLSQLNAIFGANGLTQADMIALSGAHTLGFPHCEQFPNRNYNFFKSSPVDPTLNKAYATQLQSDCPRIVDPDIAFSMDPVTPRTIDNQYYKNLQSGKGLVNSDQSLFTDTRYRPTVNIWASNSTAFQQAFVTAMTKLGRVGVKTGDQGNIRRNCTIFN